MSQAPNHTPRTNHAEELGRVAVKLFMGIAKQWQLNDKQSCTLAGLGSRSTLHKWKDAAEHNKPVKVSPDTLERLSYIAGIYKALQLLFTDASRWQEWVHAPNDAFGGQSAMDRMLAGKVIDLADVRRYLDGWRGAQFD